MSPPLVILLIVEASCLTRQSTNMLDFEQRTLGFGPCSVRCFNTQDADAPSRHQTAAPIKPKSVHKRLLGGKGGEAEVPAGRSEPVTRGHPKSVGGSGLGTYGVRTTGMH